MIEVLFVGLVVGFLFYEWTGYSPGGVVAPGYFAIFAHQPDRLAVTIVLALAVWGVVELLSRHLIIYGRRRLLMALLFGFALKLMLEWLQQEGPIGVLDIASIGYVVPGLIANDMLRQRPLPTIASVATVTAIVFLISLAL